MEFYVIGSFIFYLLSLMATYWVYDCEIKKKSILIPIISVIISYITTTTFFILMIFELL